MTSGTTPTSHSFQTPSFSGSSLQVSGLSTPSGNSPPASPFKALQIHSFPPKFQNCLAVICNGQLELSDPANTSENLKRKFTNGDAAQELSAFDEEVKKTILLCLKGIFAVDGGLNYCKHLNITQIKWLVGDMDSAAKSLMEEVRIPLQKLRRAKDDSDLGEALQTAYEEMPSTPVIVFGGLGGRVDHTLSNIFLLFREQLVNGKTIENHGKLFFYTRKQMIFSLNDKLGKCEVNMSRYETLALVPLYGTAERVKITYMRSMQEVVIPVLNGKIEFCYRGENEEAISIEIGKGELICCLHKDHITSSIPMNITEDPIELSFLIDTPLITLFENLLHFSNPLLQLPRDFTLTGKEHIFFPRPSQHEHYTYKFLDACTVSLIPIRGPAKGIVTKNLKWEFSDPNHSEKERVTVLHKSFVGLSNVMVKNWFRLRYDSGSLLCITTQFIDAPMISETIEKSTKNDDFKEIEKQ